MRYRIILSGIVDMNASNQWVENLGAGSRKGWMLGHVSPRRSNRQPHQAAYSKTTSRGGWVLEPAPSSQQTERPQVITLSKSSEATAVDYQWLSAFQVDALAENELDWISLLPNDWPLAIFNSSVLGVDNFQEQWNRSLQSVEVLVQMTQEAHCYPVIVADETCWSYTCCLQLAELGRVRFVVCFRDSERSGKYAALVTNRLDWSPRKIISRYFQCCHW